LETRGIGPFKDFLVPLFLIECQDDTGFEYLHKRMLNSIGLENVKAAVTKFLMDQGPNRPDAQKKMFGSSNLIVATQVLSIGDEQLAWKWLTGSALNATELRSLNVTANLEDTADLTDVVIRLGRLFQAQGRRIVFLVDEAEGLKNVTKPNAQRSWHDGIHRLAGTENNAIGFVLAIYVDNTHQPPEFITEEDIIGRRIPKSDIIDLAAYADPDEVRAFLTDLLNARVDFSSIASYPQDTTRETYPFTADAMDLFFQEILAGASPTPSKIIEAISESALAAHLASQDKIDLAVVQEVVPPLAATT
jgi:hypothetical protein